MLDPLFLPAEAAFVPPLGQFSDLTNRTNVL